MKRFPKSFIRDYMLTALVFVLFGVLFLVYPSESGKIICYILGGFLCLVGIFRTVEYFMTPVTLHEYSLGLVMGLIAIGCGVFILIRPELIVKVLHTVLGVAVLLDSIIKLQNTLDMIRLHDKNWRYTLIMTIVTAALGTILLINPFKAMETLLKFIGISLIINGVMDAVAMFALYSRIKQVEMV
ncbi:MAG: hypothetical protein GXY01_10830 [Clostridiales bacterium]|jgi:uncharacterized membrane protein HdeD (DUF308 family)|nr:hypothetical protein [Clostridiales bacterium]